MWAAKILVKKIMSKYLQQRVLSMKFIKLFFFLTAILVSSASFATERREADGYDVLVDTVLRPVSFVGMLAGSVVYVGLSPLTAIASIPAPHDAFKLLADTLIVKPAKYTFVRPVGDYAYSEGLR